MDCDTVSCNKKGPSGAGTEGTSSKGPSSAASASSRCFNAKTLWRRRRCCRRKNVSSQVMWRSSAPCDLPVHGVGVPRSRGPAGALWPATPLTPCPTGTPWLQKRSRKYTQRKVCLERHEMTQINRLVPRCAERKRVMVNPVTEHPTQHTTKQPEKQPRNNEDNTRPKRSKKEPDTRVLQACPCISPIMRN